MHLDTSLSYFYAVVQAGSVRRGAERLHVSASAVSRMIQKVEDRFRTTLFERRVSGMVLTPSGRILYQHLASVMKVIGDAEARIAELKGLEYGEISVFGADAALPEIIGQFRHYYPNISVTARMCSTDQVVRSLLAYEADVGIACDLAEQQGIEVLHRFPFRICAIMALGHPLAAEASVTLQQIAAFPVAMVDPEFGIRRIIDRAFNGAGIPVSPAVTTNSIDLLRRVAAAGDVITFASVLTVRSEISATAIAAVPINDAHDLRGEIVICKRRDRTLLPPSIQFINMIRVVYERGREAELALKGRGDC